MKKNLETVIKTEFPIVLILGAEIQRRPVIMSEQRITLN